MGFNGVRNHFFEMIPDPIKSLGLQIIILCIKQEREMREKLLQKNKCLKWRKLIRIIK